MKRKFVYIAKDIKENLYKIGYSQNVEKRISSLNTNNPNTIVLIDYFLTSNYKDLEKKVHKFLIQYKVYKKEWFKINVNLLENTIYFIEDYLSNLEEKYRILNKG